MNYSGLFSCSNYVSILWMCISPDECHIWHMTFDIFESLSFTRQNFPPGFCHKKVMIYCILIFSFAIRGVVISLCYIDLQLQHSFMIGLTYLPELELLQD